MLNAGVRVLLMSPSFRQCVVGDTYVCTNNGLEKVSSLVDKPDVMASYSGMYNCSAIYKNLPEKVVNITVSGGLKLGGALDHNILVMSSDGNMVFKPLDRVCLNDYVCVKCGSMVFGGDVNLSSYRCEFSKSGNLRAENIPEILNSDLSYFLGLVVGDGCLTKENYITFSK
jgi:ribonucleoside-diphosphate reductase alpha chain